MSKKELGQYYSTNSEYLLQGHKIPPHFGRIIEPFVGQGDLLSFVLQFPWIKKARIYDIDPQFEKTIRRDTLRDIPDYEDQFILTNPPYLARNKAPKKYLDLFEKYQTNDLYKCFLKSLVWGKAGGGLVIIPLNFWCSQRTQDIELRNYFLSYFQIQRVNIFEEITFEDTSYSVCSISFLKTQEKELTNQVITCFFYPSEEQQSFLIKKEDRWLIGGDLWHFRPSGKYRIGRLLKENQNQTGKTSIFLNGIDTKKCPIQLQHRQEPFWGKDTDRAFATLWILPEINFSQQEKIITQFNQLLNQKRKELRSLFLTNYREKKRKRITFDLVYLWVAQILDNLDQNE